MPGEIDKETASSLLSIARRIGIYSNVFKGARKLPTCVVEMNCPFGIVTPIPKNS